MEILLETEPVKLLIFSKSLPGLLTCFAPMELIVFLVAPASAQVLPSPAVLAMHFCHMN